MADLQDERPEQFYASMSREVGRTMTIHKRSLWERTPMLARLPPEELEAISPDDGWFIFGVVRHPAARVWSAWQSKLLLREPWWAERFGSEPWFPRIPAGTDDIREDFGRFVAAIADEPDHPIMRNRHLGVQSPMLAADRMPYSRIYRTDEIPLLLADFDRHLRAQGWDGTLSLTTSNESPLRPLRSLFTDPVVDGIQRLYAEDFERFGYDDPRPSGLSDLEHYPADTLAEVARLVERAERINDVILQARAATAAARKRTKAARQRAQAAEQRAQAAENRLPSRRVRVLAYRARGRIRRALPRS